MYINVDKSQIKFLQKFIEKRRFYDRKSPCVSSASMLARSCVSSYNQRSSSLVFSVN
nr:hypothetical protein [bacterium]